MEELLAEEQLFNTKLLAGPPETKGVDRESRGK